ncbi:hypothetical protein, partial [Paraburkholderia hospita]
CRPAQGRRVEHESNARMPTQTRANQTDRAAKAKRKCQRKVQNTDRQRARREGKTQIPAQSQKHPTTTPAPRRRNHQNIKPQAMPHKQ